jgi:hypothetical protein
MIRRLVRKYIPTLFAIVTGLLVLLGYLMPTQPLTDIHDRLVEWRADLVEWATIVAAFAFLLGVLNVGHVHVRRLVRSRQGRFYSLALLGGMAAALVVTLLPIIGASGEPTRWMVKYGINPLGASLAALVVFTLALAAFRLLRARRSMEALGFILIVIVALAISTPLMGIERLPFFGIIRDWLVNVLGMAGMRGLLLGVALGTLITALRILMGVDRPHSEL